MNTVRLPFTKMEGLGNDYVYVNGFLHDVLQPEKLSQLVADRHFGIGGDGLIIILPSPDGAAADGFFRMRMFNADGSEAEMCGNGIRCVGRYVFDKGLTKQRTLRISTRAGVKELQLAGSGGKVTGVRVDMGEPELRCEKVPVNLACDRAVDVPLEIAGEELRFTAVSMGNPHALIFVSEITDRHVHQLGPIIENHALFPKRTNVEFLQVKSRSELKMRVWERGSGETLACGTGACAAAVAAIILGHCDRKVTVELLGGNLEIFWPDGGPDKKFAEAEGILPGRVYMTGPAELVFEGTIEVDGGFFRR